MTGIRRVFRRLRKLDDPAVDRAMAAALATADRESVKLIAFLLLDRAHADGLSALVMAFHDLPPEAQAAVVKHASALDGALRHAGTKTDTPGPTNMLRIIRQAGAAPLAYLVVEQLRRGSDDLRDEAAACIVELARSVAIGPGPRTLTPCDPTTAGFVQAAVEDAVVTFAAHERPQAIRALSLLMPRAMPTATEALREWQNPAVESARQFIAEANDADTRRSILAFAAMPTMGDAAADALAGCIIDGGLGDVLHAWHLVELPAVREAIGRLHDLEPGHLKASRVSEWPSLSGRGLPRWLAAAPMLYEDRLATLADAAGHPDRGTRLAALRALIDLSEVELAAPEPEPRHARPHADQAEAVLAHIEVFCFDGEARISRIALRHLVRCRWDRLPQLLLQLVNVEHPEVRQFAGDYLAPLGFNRFWANWPALGEDQRLIAGRALIKIDPSFHRHLAEKLNRPVVEDRLRALGMIATLNQGAFFEEALVQLAGDEDPMIVSATVRALGGVESPGVVAELEKAMDHRDSRVRANAVEALQQLNCNEHVNQLQSMASSEENRPRANAIGHLLDLDSGEAINALRTMLHDDRDRHRTSALWLVQTRRLIDLARHVAEMSVSDPDVDLRRRARRVIDELIDVMERESTGEFDTPNQAAALLAAQADHPSAPPDSLPLP